MCLLCFGRNIFTFINRDNLANTTLIGIDSINRIVIIHVLNCVSKAQNLWMIRYYIEYEISDLCLLDSERYSTFSGVTNLYIEDFSCDPPAETPPRTHRFPSHPFHLDISALIGHHVPSQNVF